MSHYTRVATKITKKSALVKALCKMGFQEHMIESFDEAQNLKGYSGDTRKQKAHIRIKGQGWGSSYNYVGGASNDLGFERNTDGTYSLHVSEYDSGKYNQEWQKKLIKQYAAEVVREFAEEQNFFISSEQEVDGEIEMTLDVQF